MRAAKEQVASRDAQLEELRSIEAALRQQLEEVQLSAACTVKLHARCALRHLSVALQTHSTHAAVGCCHLRPFV